MEMQDNEFDQLFNSKLKGFEAEPSADLWKNIEQGLEDKKPVRSIGPYLSIAASIVVLASVAIWFFNATQQTPAQKPVKLVKQTRPVKQQPLPHVVEPFVDVNAVDQNAQLKINASAKIITKQLPVYGKTETALPAQQQVVTALPEKLPAVTDQVLAVAPVEKQPDLQSAGPENDDTIKTEFLADTREGNLNKTNEVSDFPGPDKVPAKKKAHGLGGLFNTIIAAVDKREDKLIEFTDANNDDGTRVTGINLGIFKIKKQ